jgi:hypothetical protein
MFAVNFPSNGYSLIRDKAYYSGFSLTHRFLLYPRNSAPFVFPQKLVHTAQKKYSTSSCYHASNYPHTIGRVLIFIFLELIPHRRQQFSPYSGGSTSLVTLSNASYEWVLSKQMKLIIFPELSLRQTYLPLLLWRSGWDSQRDTAWTSTCICVCVGVCACACTCLHECNINLQSTNLEWNIHDNRVNKVNKWLKYEA